MGKEEANLPPIDGILLFATGLRTQYPDRAFSLLGEAYRSIC